MPVKNTSTQLIDAMRREFQSGYQSKKDQPPSSGYKNGQSAAAPCPNGSLRNGRKAHVFKDGHRFCGLQIVEEGLRGFRLRGVLHDRSGVDDLTAHLFRGGIHNGEALNASVQ